MTAMIDIPDLDDIPRLHGIENDWAPALNLVARTFRDTAARHGPDSVANKLIKGFIGSAKIDTNSRLCMASSVAGHRRAFGSATVPGLDEDFDRADFVVLTGSDLAWFHPVLHQRLQAAKAARPGLKIVVIDPRRSPPDTDLAPETLTQLLNLRATTRRTVTVHFQGINQSDTDTDKINAILNCRLATGRNGQPGMGPFSVTGQPTAMGGREAGGMANMLACHLDLETSAHRAAMQTFWDAPTIVTNSKRRSVANAPLCPHRVRRGPIGGSWPKLRRKWASKALTGPALPRSMTNLPPFRRGW